MWSTTASSSSSSSSGPTTGSEVPMASMMSEEEREAVRVEVRALLAEGVGAGGGGGRSGVDVAERQQFLTQAEQMLRSLQPRSRRDQEAKTEDPSLIEQSLATALPLRVDPSPPLRRALPHLIDSFLPPLLALLPDRPPSYPLLTELLRAVIALVEDESTMVARRALQCGAGILSGVLRAVALTQSQEGKLVWDEVLRLKEIAIKLVSTSHHPAIRIQLVKLLETFVLCFSSAENRKMGFSLGDIPPRHPFLMPAAISQGAECLNILLSLAKRTERERSAGERMAAINCLAQLVSQSSNLANTIIPHLNKIDPSLPSSLAPGSLMIARQTLRLALQYISKLPTCAGSGLAGIVNAAINSIGTQYAEASEQEEKTSAASKRKAEELEAEDATRRANVAKDQPPAKRQATETNLPAAATQVPGAFPHPSYPGAPAASTVAPPIGVTGNLGPSPVAGYVPGLGASLPPAGPAPGSSNGPTPRADGADMNSASVLTRFVLEHLARLPPRELIRNDPLPPIDLENLIKLLAALSAARLQPAVPAIPPVSVPAPTAGSVPVPTVAPVAPSRDPRARKEEDISATVPPLPSLTKPEPAADIDKASIKLPPKVVPTVLPIPVVLPTIAPVTLSEADLSRQLTMAAMRIVKAESKVATAGAGGLRRALLARLATTHSLDSDFASQLIQNIAQNLVLRYEMALEWLYHEAVSAAGEESEGEENGDEGQSSKGKDKPDEGATNEAIKSEHDGESNEMEVTDGGGEEEESPEWGKGKYAELLRRLMEAVDAQELSTPQENVYCRLLSGVPLLTPASIAMIEQYVTSGRRVNLGLTLLKDMVIERPSVRKHCLHSLLSYTLHADESVRGPAVRLVAYKLFPEEALASTIERFARGALFSFVDSQSSLQQEKESAEEDQKDKDGETGKDQDKEIALYFALCMKKPSLLDGLLEAYTRAGVTVKKGIHKQAPQVIRTIGMSHPYIRQMVLHFPKGAETFVLQALHLLTDQAAPTAELTEAVKETYTQRTQDARFLIPVLSGLSKDDVISNLPKLINLPPAIVKNVIHRLLHNKPTPITPEELLIALHVVDQDKKEKEKEKEKVPLRKVVEAIQCCMEQKEYSQGILAIVLQQLIDVSPLPALLMRTIIQTVTKYPKLTGFVMGLLGRLIAKQVWTDERLWQGWVKCCRSTTPHSYPIILQLPPRQVEDVLQKHPELKEPLAQYHKTNPTMLPRSVLLLLGLIT